MLPPLTPNPKIRLGAITVEKSPSHQWSRNSGLRTPFSSKWAVGHLGRAYVGHFSRAPKSRVKLSRSGENHGQERTQLSPKHDCQMAQYSFLKRFLTKLGSVL